MNEPGSNFPLEEADEKMESLRSQMNLLFGCVLVASITLTAYLALQARRAYLDCVALRGPAIESYQAMQQEDAAVEATYGRLSEFARTHPDFQKAVLSNFTISTNNLPAAPTKK